MRELEFIDEKELEDECIFEDEMEFMMECLLKRNES